MFKNYTKFNANGLIKPFVSLLVMGCSALGLKAQLSGSYTINPLGDSHVDEFYFVGKLCNITKHEWGFG
ncbi:MAG: hypothetical protein ACK5EQ_06810 [Bacteroidota bacterium]